MLPRVEALQDYVWRRHLASAGNRLMAQDSAGSDTSRLAVVFVDIVGFTSRSKELTETELVTWIEYFEAECSGLVVDHGGRVIKNIGDEVLYVADDVASATEAALTMTARGEDPDDDFPEVRAGLAYGDAVSRLGDVFGPTVNIASRLTSLARPGHGAGRPGRARGAQRGGPARAAAAAAHDGEGLRPPAVVGGQAAAPLTACATRAAAAGVKTIV